MATDREPLAAGFGLSDAYYVTRPLRDPPAYRDAAAMIKAEGVTIILPTCGSDTREYAVHRQELAASGVVFVGSDAAVIDLCEDKLAFWQATQADFPLPSLVAIGPDGPVSYPSFVKPRSGSGGRGSGLCRKQQDWQRLCENGQSELLAQEFLPGTEYSVHVLCDLAAHPLVAIPRERISIIDGVSSRARVFHDVEIERLCLDLAAFLELKGPSCIQLKRDHRGSLKLQEVNTRLGGSSVASALAGIDLALLSVKLGIGMDFEIPEFREVTVLRYFSEVVMPAPAKAAAGAPASGDGDTRLL